MRTEPSYYYPILFLQRSCIASLRRFYRDKIRGKTNVSNLNVSQLL